MVQVQQINQSQCGKILIEHLREKQSAILSWLKAHETSKELPLYSSVDIRDACFKIAVVDTNLFPAGFNNLCEHGIADASKYLRQAVLERVPSCRDILIVAEDHTRNTWYLENIRVIKEITQNAGFAVKIAMFFDIQPEFCENGGSVQLETATKKLVRIHCLRRLLEKFPVDQPHFDLIILNNDLTGGIPQILKESQIPIYPSIQAGWHSRSKSRHFKLANELLKEFAKIINMDPWFFSCLYRTIDQVDINQEADRQKIKLLANDLFEEIKHKYRQHRIEEKPFIFIKSDSGTYGMNVVPIEDPQDILELNRRARNNLSKGKSAQVIDRFLLQEGVPTAYQIGDQVSEACVYQITNNMVGGFYRSNAAKSERENLNSPGMELKTMCPHLPKYGLDEIHPDVNIFDVYRVLARIAGIAAHREIVQMEQDKE